jgi:tetratricopeptide (TPR) repeat protein
MFKDPIKNDEQARKKITRVLIALAVPVIVFFSILLFRPQAISTVTFPLIRIKNTISYYLLQDKPHFYYIEMEKNGNDIRINADESLEVTYRDEFVVKSVASDDFTGKYTTVNVEVLGKGKNDIGLLLRGIELVNKLMQSDEFSQNKDSISGYKIHINYKNEPIAAVPMKVIITPQDWLRFAKDSKNVAVQIEYLKKAIAVNKEDIGVRKILAGTYFRQGRIDDAIKQYKDILVLKSDDTAAMMELAKCYIKKKNYDDAITICRKLIKIKTQDAQAYASLGFALSQKGLWDQAMESYRLAVKLEPDNYPVRLKLGEAYEKTKKMNLAIDEYKYLIEHSKDMDLALLALGDVHLKINKYEDAIKYYKELIKKQPRLAAAYANLAQAFAGLG